MKLTAIWDSKQVPSIDSPRSITWGDGHPASLRNYMAHSTGTGKMALGQRGHTELHMFSEIAGEAYFDRYAKTWAIRGDCTESTSLDLDDAHASNEAITLALATLPMSYRVRIVRGSQNGCEA